MWNISAEIQRFGCENQPECKLFCAIGGLFGPSQLVHGASLLVQIHTGIIEELSGVFIVEIIILSAQQVSIL